MQKNNYIQRIQNLSPKQRKLLGAQIQEERQSAKHVDHQRLVAYLVGEGDLNKVDLMAHLKMHLPDYMVPSNIIQLDEMPRLPNGKVNLQGLPVSEEISGLQQSGFAEPRTAVEKQLAAIWEVVLNFEPVGIHDNFFEIGGDSILSIQIIAKARKAGMVLAANQIFEHQTIAELALFVQATAEQTQVETEIVTGPVPLLPIQHWFFEEHRTAPYHWNQGMIFRLDRSAEAGILKRAVKHLIVRHEALRLHFTSEKGEWKASILKPEDIQSFHQFNLSELTLEEQEKGIKERSDAIHAGFELADGSLFQVVYFDCGTVQPNRLLLVAHHLVVDNVSWQFLLDNLSAAIYQLVEGKEDPLPVASVSFKKWGERLVRMAEGQSLLHELAFWQQQTQLPVSLPTDFEIKLPVPESGIATIHFELDTHTTTILLNAVPAAYNTRTDEVLIAALVNTITRWANTSSLCLGLERHGRETVNHEVDVSGLVGWLTAYFPLTFHLEGLDDTGAIIKFVKEQLRSVPGGGLGYGLLRYLGKEGSSLNQRPSVIFNYLGQQEPFESAIMTDMQMADAGARDPRSERYHLLEINAFIAENSLQMNWSYSRDLHLNQTIQLLLKDYEKTLRRFIDHCREQETGEYTPSDFPEAGLNQDDLDRLLDNIEL